MMYATANIINIISLDEGSNEFIYISDFLTDPEHPDAVFLVS